MQRVATLPLPGSMLVKGVVLTRVIRRSLMWERARVSTTRKLYQGVVLGVSVLACGASSSSFLS